jgi:hypothetical protein
LIVWLLMMLVLGVAATSSAQSELVIVKDNAAKEYHRPGCPVVRNGTDVVAMTRAEAVSRGFKSHRDCESAMPGGSAQSETPPPKPKEPPQTVYVDRAPKYYHRKTCAKLGAHPEAVALTAVGKRWPCPTCRPPVSKRTAEPLVPRWRG